MKTVTFEVPNLYGDHHVVEVRRILLEIPGVVDVYASSAFRMVEVSFDPEKTNDLVIALALDESGYLGEWSVPMEASSLDVPGRPFTIFLPSYRSIRNHPACRKLCSKCCLFR